MKIAKLLTKSESKTLEFKRDASSLEPILKTIVAFANTAGGIIVIGYSPEGVITGINNVFKAEETLTNAITDSIRPLILPEIEVTTLNGKNLLIIKVSYWKAPFYLKKKGFPNGVYIRLGSTNRPADKDLLVELKRSALTLSFDQQGLDLPKEVLDMTQISKLFESVGKKITKEKLCSLGILAPSIQRIVPSIGGFILFGKKAERERLIPDAKVSCARFQGTTKSTILDQKEIEGTILQAVREVPKFIARNTRLTSQIKKMQRKDIPEYPLVALREALINALAHADYSLKGSHIQIAIFDDRLEIQNPGMLPFGFTIEDLKAGISRIRNRVIARVFHNLHLMEEWGSGYKRIIEVCHKEGYPEPKWEEIGMTFRVTFYPHSQSLINKRQEPSIEFIEREEVILNLFKKNESLPFREIFKRLPYQISERMLRYNLAQLKKKGLLASKGKGPATIWHKK